MENGSAGADQTRTVFELNATVAIPWLRWGAAPYITSPITFALSGFIKPTQAVALQYEEEPAAEHPFHTAMRWAKDLCADPGLSRATIARKAGISRARVTQILNLLLLPKPIQECLSSPPVPLTMSSFSERSLRRVLVITGETEQIRAWNELLHEITTSRRGK